MSWNFDKSIKVEEFNKHIQDSIPFYDDVEKIIADICNFYCKEDGWIIDIGCSTGNVIQKLSRKNFKNYLIDGYDKSENMCKYATNRFKDFSNIRIINKDILDTNIPKGLIDVFVASLTLQFIELENRKCLLEKVYDSLKHGGVFIVFEKIYANKSEYDNIYTQMYKDFKKNNFNSDEILKKEFLLRGVLNPLSEKENLELFKSFGFEVEIFYKCLNFEGYILKKNII